MKRGKWTGVMTIAQLNWPFYAAGAVLLVVSIPGLVLSPGVALKLAFLSIFTVTGFFMFGSLAASHLIYDRSDLYKWNWLERALGGVDIREAIYCHCGFDDASGHLRERFPEVKWRILDHFEEERMTEGSIRRARAIYPPTATTVSCNYDAWPLPPESTDVVFALLAIHELRTEAERSAWFAEAKRCLRKGGRVVFVEHLRNAANFLAFGPGFLHFHSRESWRRSWELAGLHPVDQFDVTPFVRIVVLRKA